MGVKLLFDCGADQPQLLVVGITPGNIAKLKNDEPLMINATDVTGLSINIAIIYGESNSDHIRKLADAGLMTMDDATKIINKQCSDPNCKDCG